jgi:hypothetical protein
LHYVFGLAVSDWREDRPDFMGEERPGRPGERREIGQNTTPAVHALHLATPTAVSARIPAETAQAMTEWRAAVE